MTARCNTCGQEWPRDPALEVACPDCHARVGSDCRRPSGHACVIHAARDRLAIDSGFLNPCSAAQHPPHTFLEHQFDLFPAKLTGAADVQPLHQHA